MKISQTLADEIIAHALEDRPNECCGMISGKDGEATEVFRGFNEMASPFSFKIKTSDMIRIYNTN